MGGEGGGRGKNNLHGRKGIWGGGVRGKQITVRMDPSPSFLGSSVNDLQYFGRKTKIE